MKKWLCLMMAVIDIVLVIDIFYQLGRLYAFTP